MIDVAMKNGDLVASDYGDILLHLSDDDNIIQMANNAIYTIKGENIFHPGYGDDAWNKRLKISQSGFDTVNACVKEAILHGVPEVSEVVSVNSAKSEENVGECVVSYILLTNNGKRISSSTTINIL